MTVYITRRENKSDPHTSVMANDHAPTYGLDYLPDNRRAVFVSAVSKQYTWRTYLSANDLEQALKSWLFHGLGQGVIGVSDTALAITNTDHAEAVIDSMLEQLPDETVRRIVTRIRKRTDYRSDIPVNPADTPIP